MHGPRISHKVILSLSKDEGRAGAQVQRVEQIEFLVVGCGPAGGVAAREAARSGVGTVVLEKDSVVGEKRVCAAGLRPGFCGIFDLPSSIVHCDTPRLALFDPAGKEYELAIVPGHT